MKEIKMVISLTGFHANVSALASFRYYKILNFLFKYTNTNRTTILNKCSHNQVYGCQLSEGREET